MNRRQSTMHPGAATQPRAPTSSARESGRTAVVEAARALVHTKGTIAFLNREKAMAWADLQMAIDAFESS